MSQNVKNGQIWINLKRFMDSYAIHCKGKSLLAKVMDKILSDKGVHTKVDVMIVKHRMGQSNVLTDRTLFHIAMSDDMICLVDYLNCVYNRDRSDLLDHEMVLLRE